LISKMARIDFVGPMGVGKSTLYRALLEKTRGRRAWLTEQEAAVAIAAKVFRNSRTTASRLRLAGLHFPFLRRRIAHAAMERACAHAAWNDPAQWGRFLQQCHQFTAEDPSESLRIHAAQVRLWRRIQVVAAAESYLSGSTVVFDESIYHAVLAVMTPSQCTGDKLIRRCFDAVPLADGLVHVRAGADLICDRLLKREAKKNRKIMSIRLLDDREICARVRSQLTSIQAALEVVRKAGIPVFEVDASTSFAFKLNALIEFVNSIANGLNNQGRHATPVVVGRESTPSARVGTTANC
jgi:hypothetical protein